MRKLGTEVSVAFVIGALTLVPLPAQKPARCKILCSPELKLEPTFTIENLFNPPRISELENGAPVGTATAEREAVFEIVLALDVPTEIPRVGLTVETIWAPFSGMAGEPGEEESRENSVELEFELNLTLLEEDQTGGWFESHFDIVDQFSPAERPGETAAYTHKLNFELDTAFFVFHWLPKRHWLHNIELEGSLDFLATGIPRAGDVLENELFLDDADPWSFSIVLVIPIAPFLQ